ncbi:MAG: translation initiation factor [Planctomycetota bacterium]
MMRLFEGTEFDIPPRCERCNELEEECNCPPPAPEMIPPEKQTAKIQVEKRKRGKVVTVIRGLPAAGNDLSALLSKLKSVCGAGGTLKDEQLELQGDHRETATKLLSEIGYKVKA